MSEAVVAQNAAWVMTDAALLGDGEFHDDLANNE